MRVIVTEEEDEYGEFASLSIEIDDKTKFSVYHSDSPEDNNLFRNFSDCYDIPSLLRKAWQAGKNGEEFEIEYLEVGEDE